MNNVPTKPHSKLQYSWVSTKATTITARLDCSSASRIQEHLAILSPYSKGHKVISPVNGSFETY